MKQSALVYASLLLCSLSLAAGDKPVGEPQPLASFLSPPSCNAGPPAGMKPVPEPLPQSILQPPCIGTTDCNNGSSATCPTVSYSAGCYSEPGCWAFCGDSNSYVDCPDKPQDCWYY